MIRVLITGDRNWTDVDCIRQVLGKIKSNHGTDVVFIEGEAAGADSIGRDVAHEFGWRVLPFPAEWHKYGKRAGPLRNIQMVREGYPDIVVAFHTDILKSKGTRHMVEYSLQCGLPVLYYNGNGCKIASLPLEIIRKFNFNGRRASY